MPEVPEGVLSLVVATGAIAAMLGVHLPELIAVAEE